MIEIMRAALLFWSCLAVAALAGAQTPAFDVRCVDGRAAGFPCDRVHLLAYLPLSAVGSSDGTNDVWGFSEGGREFVLLGLRNGIAFVEITNPTAPLYLGRLPGEQSIWRDIEIHQRHAYIASEAFNHGVQVFDLGLLFGIGAPPVEFSEAVRYRGEGLGGGHTLSINEASGFLYVSGSNTCNGGLHMVDIRTPKEPRFAGCFSEDGYSHDAQCITYDGPDPDYRGREICFASNEDTLTVVDVTDKAAPRMVSRTSYQGVGYIHQTWVTADKLFLLMDDELDEQYYGHNTSTRIWDIADLDRPVHIGSHVADTPAIDHNLYVRDRLVYQANYRAGLRILRLDRIAEGRLEPAGFFDIYPTDDAPSFNGAWSVYPFFPSGVVAISGIEQGLFLVRPEIP
jgi:choice-of-anchor B domain-containing protein